MSLAPLRSSPFWLDKSFCTCQYGLTSTCCSSVADASVAESRSTGLKPSPFLSFHQSHVKSCPPGVPATADGDVISRCLVEQAVFIMGQISRCCMVCLMPQSQVSGSFEYLHFNMFILDRQNCLCNLLSASHDTQGFSAPAGRCWSALMVRCTLAYRGPSRSLHNCMRAAFAVVWWAQCIW